MIHTLTLIIGNKTFISISDSHARIFLLDPSFTRVLVLTLWGAGCPGLDCRRDGGLLKMKEGRGYRGSSLTRTQGKASPPPTRWGVVGCPPRKGHGEIPENLPSLLHIPVSYPSLLCFSPYLPLADIIFLSRKKQVYSTLCELNQ